MDCNAAVATGRSSPHLKGFMFINGDKAFKAGLPSPLSETVRDTLNWDRTDLGNELKAGIDKVKEQALLAKWHETSR